LDAQSGVDGDGDEAGDEGEDEDEDDDEGADQAGGYGVPLSAANTPLDESPLAPIVVLPHHPLLLSTGARLLWRLYHSKLGAKAFSCYEQVSSNVSFDDFQQMGAADRALYMMNLSAGYVDEFLDGENLRECDEMREPYFNDPDYAKMIMSQLGEIEDFKRVAELLSRQFRFGLGDTLKEKQFEFVDAVLGGSRLVLPLELDILFQRPI
jgi:hypothetical protein